MYRRAPWLLLACGLLACESAPVDLIVDLRTDFVAGAEFDGVEIALDGAAPELFDVSGAEPFLEGVRVASFAAEPGERRVTLTMRRGADEVFSRALLVSLGGPQAVTIVAARDCVGVACAGDQVCHGGECAEARCSPETPGACPEPECAAPSDCDAPHPCAAARCLDGVCLYEDTGALCGELAYCDPMAGCEYTDPLDQGLVTWLSLDTIDGDGVEDRAGMLTNGTCAVSECPTATDGAVDGALDHDGVDDVIRVASDPALDFESAGTAMTITIWVRPDTVTVADRPMGDRQMVAVAKPSSGGCVSYQLSLLDMGQPTFGARFIIYDSADAPLSAQANVPLSANEWTLLVGTWDRSVARLYVNGVEVATEDVPSMAFGPVDLILGADDEGGGALQDYFAGALDDVRIYDRALDGTEVMRLYTRSAP